jgi:hypothetical protein
MRRHENNAGLVRYSVCMTPGTKKALDEYAYASKQTVALALDVLVREGAEKHLAEMGIGSGPQETVI